MRVGINQRVALSGLGEGGWRIMHRGNAEGIVFAELQSGEIGPANAHRVFQHSLEYRLELTRRTADDLEHVGGGRLLLQRFAQLIEQPRVLDGDDGLRGKVRDKLDLLVGKRSYLLAVDDDAADQLAILEHRHEQHCARPSAVDQATAAGRVRCSPVCPEIGQMNTLFVVARRASGTAVRRRAIRGSRCPKPRYAGGALCCARTKRIILR